MEIGTERSGLPFKALGVFWILVGLASLGLSPLLFLFATVFEVTEPTPALLGILPVILYVIVFAILAFAAGGTLLARRRVARWLTVASSVVLTPALGFLIILRITGGAGIDWAAALFAFLLIISIYGLWAMMSGKGQRAFDAYVRVSGGSRNRWRCGLTG